MPKKCPPGSSKLRVFLVPPLVVFFLAVAASAQTCTPGTWSEASQPPTTCIPYPTPGLFQKQLPNAGTGGPMTHLATNSDVTAQTAVTDNGVVGSSDYGRGQVASPGDNDIGGVPIYYGRSSDPIYQTSCVNGSPTYIHIPNQARMAGLGVGGSDQFFTVWDQTTNLIFTGYAYNQSVSGGTLPNCTATTNANACSFSFMNYCGQSNYSTNQGYLTGSGVDTLGSAPDAMTIRANEWVNNQINHALYLDTHCENASTVFPGSSHAKECISDGVSDTNRPPHGALIFLDYTDTQLSGMGLPAWQYNILRAWTHYGGYIGDTGGNGTSLGPGRYESGEGYRLAGITDPVFGSTQNNGWL